MDVASDGGRAYRCGSTSGRVPRMKFNLVDKVIEESPDRIVALKAVTLAEEYLADHFPAYPVLPGVLMIETLVQAARRLLAGRSGDWRLVLGEVKALRYGAFVRPGEVLKVEVSVLAESGGEYRCKGTGWVLKPGVENTESREAASGAREAASGETAVSGRFTMRAIRPDATQ
jgi:3-hydroxyacyl-[acyl-carrier-protein] dehydratase